MMATMRRLGVMCVLAGVVTAGTLGASDDAQARTPKFKTYTVQPGDSVWSIAEEFYGSGDKYRLIYKHNPFSGVPPYILVPGQVLRLPIGAISPEAQVDWKRRDVKAKPPRSVDWLKANNKMNLWKLYKVSTGDESAVHIVFEDSSEMRLGDDALLVIYGGNSGSAQSRKRRKTHVKLEQGTMRGGLAALDAMAGVAAPPVGGTSGDGGGGQSSSGDMSGGGTAPGQSLLVETPSGKVELASSSVQVTATKTTSAVSVYQGSASVSGGGRTVKVKKGYGTVVKKGKKPEKPRPLPAVPAWTIEGDGDAVAVVPAGGRSSFNASWQPVKGAAQYRLELAHDEKFRRVEVDAKVDGKITRFQMDNIPAGQYYARISARDARGLEGHPSPKLALNVVGLQSSRRLLKSPEGEQGWEVAGLSRLELGESGIGLEWAIDDGDFVAGTEPARVQGIGAHVIKVRRAGQTIETPFHLKVLRVDATFDLDMAEGPIPAGGEGRAVALTVVDERGRPTSLPGVSLRLPDELDGSGDPIQVPLKEAGPGKWTATVPAPAAPGPERLKIEARWLGGSLATASAAVAQKFPLVPYTYTWRRTAPGLAWEGRLAATQLPSLVPVTRLSTQIAAFRRRGHADLGISVQGEVAVADGKLGLDGALMLFRPPIEDDASVTNELGDAIVGIRYRVFDGPRFALAPSLRARLPLRDRDGTFFWGVEPSLLLRWWAGPKIWLESRQGVMLAINGKASANTPTGTDATYIGDYAMIWRATKTLSINLLLDSAITLSTPVEGLETVALGAGIGAQLAYKRVRFGFNVGFGLGDGGKQRFGDVAGALTLDFGFGTP
ncbi:MAG: LysM repeat protein [Myxococcota bacterium]|jgi:LysM repeat protein